MRALLLMSHSPRQQQQNSQQQPWSAKFGSVREVRIALAGTCHCRNGPKHRGFRKGLKGNQEGEKEDDRSDIKSHLLVDYLLFSFFFLFCGHCMRAEYLCPLTQRTLARRGGLYHFQVQTAEMRGGPPE